MPQPVKIELLAPARDAVVAVEAIRHGADAVYIGAESFGARAAAGNSVDDIARVVDYARRFDARVYVTVNTIIYESELREVERLVGRLYRAGVDALIVQDMALLRMDIPPIALHASTQCDTRTPARARFLQDAGFSQIVLPRELSLSEIKAMREAVDVPLEAFVHGALCVSYSGDCHASAVLRGRSANRGECAQICRLPYDLYDGDGRCVERGRHMLSLRDMNRSDRLESMLEAGVASFKIEGRLKDAGYVKNVVACYRRELDRIFARSDGRYCRLSSGEVRLGFEPVLAKSFNRGFTGYFIDGPSSGKIASIYTPKSQGERVGVVSSVRGGVVEARLDVALANGDGLACFTHDKTLQGFRLNRVDGCRLYPAGRVDLRPGTVLYRNSDKAFDDLLAKSSASRIIKVSMRLRVVGADRIVLEMSDDGGCEVAVARCVGELAPARSSQYEARRRVLSKLGNTDYELAELVDDAGDRFIAAGVLAAVRREAVKLFDTARTVRYRRELRRPERRDAVFPDGPALSYHENVANSLARGFYEDHGVTSVEPAVEVATPRRVAGLTVMTTRYCLRRELGACLREGGDRRLPGPLRLESGNISLGLDFDCRNCRMHVKVLDNKKKKY